MVQSDPLLHEALAGQRRIAWFYADRSSRADAVEKPVVVRHHLHPEFGQETTIKLAGSREFAHRQDHMRHSIDLNGHRSHLQAVSDSSTRGFPTISSIPQVIPYASRRVRGADGPLVEMGPARV